MSSREPGARTGEGETGRGLWCCVLEVREEEHPSIPLERPTLPGRRPGSASALPSLDGRRCRLQSAMLDCVIEGEETHDVYTLLGK